MFEPALTIVAVATPARTLSLGDDAWLWVERISAIVTILGLGALFYQLRQMTRRPKLRVGFHRDPGGTGTQTRKMQTVETIEVPVQWRQGQDLSEPTKLWVVVVNELGASGTAWNVNAEVRYPPWLVPEGVSDDLKQPPGMNLWQLSKQQVELNPGVAFWLRGTFRVPRGRTHVQIHAIASMRDSGPIDKMLTVTLTDASDLATFASSAQP